MKRYALVVAGVVLAVTCILTFAWAIRSGPSASHVGKRDGTTTYEYDNLHRLTGVTYPDGSQIIYEYDANGNRTSKLVVPGANPDREMRGRP